MSALIRPALFLDRDGVINCDAEYVFEIDRFEWIPGIFETVRTANELGLKTIVVTNQAGIARGYYTERQFQRLTDWMMERFVDAGAPLVAVYFCPFHPDGIGAYRKLSALRKPAPGMLLQAATDHHIDLARSLLIGDQETDIEAGRAAGLRHTARFSPDDVPQTAASTLLRTHIEACAWIRRIATVPPHCPCDLPARVNVP